MAKSTKPAKRAAAAPATAQKSSPRPTPSSVAASDTTPGILPAQALRQLITDGALKLASPLGPRQLQPASVDLRLGPTAYRIRASFLPGPGHTVASKLEDLKLHAIDLRDAAVLETGCVYLVPLMESLVLPAAFAATTNPKSSTGRLDVFTRVIADSSAAFDQIAAGYQGPLYAEICPQTFPILVRQGSTLSQIRFRCGNPTESDDGLRVLQREMGLVSGGVDDISGGVALSVDLKGDASGLVGYRARRHTGIVDVDAPGSCAIADYWEPIHARGAGPSRHRLILDPDQFYILASKEAVHVPPTHAAEMMPFNPLVGEFRVHYAGFMDPGFGHAPAGGSGARVVLEVRSHTVPFILEDGQVIGRLVYERMSEVPDILYGRDLKSHYQGQHLKLSKHFL
jgi:dCTP deaminase